MRDVTSSVEPRAAAEFSTQQKKRLTRKLPNVELGSVGERMRGCHRTHELRRKEWPMLEAFGLKNGARTPSEIAVSILGSIIRERKGAASGGVGERSDVEEEAGR